MRRFVVLACLLLPSAIACGGGLPVDDADGDAPDVSAQDGTVEDGTIADTGSDQTVDDVVTESGDDATADATGDSALDAMGDDASDASTLDGPFDAGDGGIVVLAAALNNPFRLVVDSDNVYWTNRDGGSVMQCAVGGCGGTPIVLAPSESTPTGIAIDSSHVYWANYSGGGGTIRSCPIGGGDGGSVKTIASQSVIAPVDVAVEGTNVYFTDQSADKVQVCPSTGCASTPPVIASSQGGANGIAADTATLYWAATINNTISDIALPGDAGTPKVIQTNAGAAWIAVNSGYVYWATYNSGAVFRCSASNCGNTLSLLASQQTGATGQLATDGVNAYWTIGGASGSVMKCAVGGCNGTPTVLASSLSYPVGLAVDSTSVYVALDTKVIKLTPK